MQLLVHNAGGMLICITFTFLICFVIIVKYVQLTDNY